MLKKIAIVCLMGLVALTVVAQDDDIPLPITEDVVYTVVPADTVDGIGALFDVSPTCIAEQNELKNNLIKINQELTISVSCPRYGEDARDEGQLEVLIPREVVTFEDECTGYRVQQLDSLDTIGQALDISVVAIAVENDIEIGDVLEVNQCLVLPENAPKYGEFPSLTVPALAGSDGQGGGLPEGAKTHVVQPRQTLDTIASLYNVDVACLANANKLTKPSLLQPGTELLIDETCPAYSPYGILPGTLATPESTDGQ
jgi:LysM repeat protein